MTKYRPLLFCAVLALLGSAAVSAGSAGASQGSAPHGRSGAQVGRQHGVQPASTARTVAARQAGLAASRHAGRTLAAGLSPELTGVAGLTGTAAPTAAGTVDGVSVSRQGTVEVTVTGSGAAAAARAVGGKVIASYAGATEVAVRPSRLAELAGRPAVIAVTKTVRATEDVTSEGVHSSNADTWQSAAPALGNGGAGVNVGIVDGGFANLSAEIAAGHFGPTDGSLVQYVSGGPQDKCDNDALSDHGTAVAEIVHQMAPNATLYLYCVDGSIGFSQVASQIVQNGAIKVVNSSLSFTGESRGDGNGGANSTEAAVRSARRAGVLWVQSAGNSAADHWSGLLRDADRDGYLDMPDPSLPAPYNQTNEVDATGLDPGTSGDVVLTWDQWPKSSLPLTLLVQTYASDNQTPIGDPIAVSQAPGTPELDISLQNTDSTVHYYDVSVAIDGAVPAIRYDLFYAGDFYPSYLAFNDPAVGAAGSVTQPATSPYAMAVGAADWRSNALEDFSSRGPTIDGRVKPDLIGYDGVSSNLGDVEAVRYDDQNPPQPIPNSLGFYGTSASAPHVAGAAALVAAANPDLDASQLEAFLESPADGSSAVSPPTNAAGHGLLNLGAADASQVTPPAGASYFPLSDPVRIADTRSGLGVRKGPMTAGLELTVPVPNTLDGQDLSNASSVVVEVSGTGTKGGTYLSVYSSSFGGNATVPLTVQEQNATVTSIVRLNPQHAFKLRNQAAQTDALITVIGFFGQAGGSGGLGYVPLPSYRLLDTRVPTGGPKGPLRPNQAVTVDATAGGVPATAGVAVLNITALNHSTGGYLTAYPASSPAVASVNYAVLSRPNLTLVPLVNGKFVLQNRFANTDAMVDVVGYFSSTATAKYVALPAPVRIGDTRSGNGGQYGVLTNGHAYPLDAGGLYGVPYSVSGVWLGLTAIGTVANPLAGAGYLTVYPADVPQPHASSLDFTGSRSILNNVIATLSARTSTAPPGFNTSDTGAAANAITDVYGYFVASGP